MPKRALQVYANQNTQDVEKFVKSLRDNAVKEGIFDSAAAADFISNASNQSTGVKIPATFQTVLDEAQEGEVALVTGAILDGANAYESQHGCPAPADLIEQALHSAYGTSQAARRKSNSISNS